MLRDINATKRQRISEILANETYTPDSGMIERLTAVLMKLSLDDLGCLELVIVLKLAEVEMKK